MASTEYVSPLMKLLREDRLFRPRLNYKTNAWTSMPPTIDPKNWTEILPEEQRKHNQRMELKGRMRRHYWKLSYHPTNGKWFCAPMSDPSVIRHNWVNSVWHISSSMKATPRLMFYIFGAWSIPIIYGCMAFNSSHFLNKYASIVKT
uniref:NADH dehydrogenase [ubiquinone] 1 beta subcomplex subunit 4 n=1 Tax=Ciona savignyi TaxID=51511 RepID=H2ZIW6_CIOSA